MTTLKEIQQQIEIGFISSTDDIRGILEHTLWKPADQIEFIMGNWLGGFFKNAQEDIGKTIPAENTAVLLDVMVMTDWCSMHIRKLGFAKQFRNEMLSIAKKDPWFKFFLNVSVNALGKFLRSKAGARPRKIGSIEKEYRAVFDKPLSDDVTIGSILNDMKNMINKSWSVADDPEEYQMSIINCCQLVQSLIHMICSGYVNVNIRVSEDDYPYKYLKECLWEEAVSAEQSGTAKERFEG